MWSLTFDFKVSCTIHFSLAKNWSLNLNFLLTKGKLSFTNLLKTLMCPSLSTAPMLTVSDTTVY